MASQNGHLTQYEELRAQRILENKRRLADLGIEKLAQQVVAVSKAANGTSRKVRHYTTASMRPPLLGPRRRSTRLEGVEPRQYKEGSRRQEERAHAEVSRRRTRAGPLVYPTGPREETYTEEHVQQLGDCREPWVLFVDGLGSDGKRLYDSVNGKTCHQCRQKTMGLRTSCSQCQSLHGQFCGDCLFMRYGENVREANANGAWVCPVCRGLCNCSFCRVKRGWPPTGSLYRKVRELGYKSVAHYLVLTNLVESPPLLLLEGADASPVPPGTPGPRVALNTQSGDIITLDSFPQQSPMESAARPPAAKARACAAAAGSGGEPAAVSTPAVTPGSGGGRVAVGPGSNLRTRSTKCAPSRALPAVQQRAMPRRAAVASSPRVPAGTGAPKETHESALRPPSGGTLGTGWAASPVATEAKGKSLSHAFGTAAKLGPGPATAGGVALRILARAPRGAASAANEKLQQQLLTGRKRRGPSSPACAPPAKRARGGQEGGNLSPIEGQGASMVVAVAAAEGAVAATWQQPCQAEAVSDNGQPAGQGASTAGAVVPKAEEGAGGGRSATRAAIAGQKKTSTGRKSSSASPLLPPAQVIDWAQVLKRRGGMASWRTEELFSGSLDCSAHSKAASRAMQMQTPAAMDITTPLAAATAGSCGRRGGSRKVSVKREVVEDVEEGTGARRKAKAGGRSSSSKGSKVA
eukprot:jgi/Mesen1/7617/ME000004S07887